MYPTHISREDLAELNDAMERRVDATSGLEADEAPRWALYRRKVPTRMAPIWTWRMLEAAGLPGGSFRRPKPGEDGDFALLTANGWSLGKMPCYVAMDPMGHPYPITFEAFNQTFDALPVGIKGRSD